MSWKMLMYEVYNMSIKIFLGHQLLFYHYPKIDEIREVLFYLLHIGNATAYRQWPQVKLCPPENVHEEGSWKWVILIETKIIVPCLISSVIFLVLLLTYELCRPGQTKQLFLLMRFNAAMMLLLYYIDLIIIKMEGLNHVR